MQYKRSKGFTIIELVIVFAILGILISISIPQYKQYIYTAKLTQIKNDIRIIQDQILINEVDNLNEKTFDKTDVANMGISINNTSFKNEKQKQGYKIILEELNISTFLEDNFYFNGEYVFYYVNKTPIFNIDYDKNNYFIVFIISFIIMALIYFLLLNFWTNNDN